MARMRSIIADVIRGSTGGLTYFANPFHQILVRQRTSPVNPQTTFQTQVRAGMAGASIDWNSLTDTQRQDWQDYADTLSYNNPLGPITVPGRQVMVGAIGLLRYAQARGFSFASTITTAPAGAGFLALDPVSVGAPTAVGTGFRIVIGNPNADDIKILYEISGIHNPARRRFKGPFRSSTLDELDVTTLTTGTKDIIVGSDGDVVFIRFRAISDDGAKRLSQAGILRAVVATTV